MTRPLDNCDYDKATHELFLKGAYSQNPFSKDRLQNSIDLLTQANCLNDHYPRGKCELAYTKVLAAISGFFQNEAPQFMRDAEKLIEEAENESLGVNDYITYWTKGFFLTNTGDIDDFDPGMNSYEHAQESFNCNTDPMDRRSGFQIEYGEALIYAGKTKEGLDKIKSWMTFPNWYYYVLSFAYNQHGLTLEPDSEANKEHQLLALESLNKIEYESDEDEFFIITVDLLKAVINEILDDIEMSKNSMISYVVNGRKTLKLISDKYDEPIEELALEKIYINEFSKWGFKDDGVSEQSKIWRQLLRASLLRSEDELINLEFDVGWIKEQEEFQSG